MQASLAAAERAMSAAEASVFAGTQREAALTSQLSASQVCTLPLKSKSPSKLRFLACMASKH